MTPTKSQYEGVRNIAVNLLGSLDEIVLHDGEAEAEFLELLSDAMDLILIEIFHWTAEYADAMSYEAIIEYCEKRIEELDA